MVPGSHRRNLRHRIQYSAPWFIMRPLVKQQASFLHGFLMSLQSPLVLHRRCSKSTVAHQPNLPCHATSSGVGDAFRWRLAAVTSATTSRHGTLQTSPGAMARQRETEPQRDQGRRAIFSLVGVNPFYHFLIAPRLPAPCIVPQHGPSGMCSAWACDVDDDLAIGQLADLVAWFSHRRNKPALPVE